MKVKLGIFLLVIFAVLLFSCEKNIETSEENNNEQFFENELTDNNENNEDKRSSMYLFYKYDGYWSMKFGEYFLLDDRNEGEYFRLDDRNEDIHTKWEGTGFIPRGPNDTQ